MIKSFRCSTYLQAFFVLNQAGIHLLLLLAWGHVKAQHKLWTPEFTLLQQQIRLLCNLAW